MCICWGNPSACVHFASLPPHIHTHGKTHVCVQCSIIISLGTRAVYMALAMRKRAFFPNVFPAIVLQLSRIMRRRSCHHHTLLLLLYCIDEHHHYIHNTHRHTLPLTYRSSSTSDLALRLRTCRSIFLVCTKRLLQQQYN